jgi:hypothetical protein
MATVLGTMGWTPVQQSPVLLGQAPAGPALQSIGPLTFAPDGVLFAADRNAATIYALELGDQAGGGAPGAANVPAIDQKIAALLGTDVKEIIVADLAVHPKTRNAYIAVMRGTGTSAQPALVRVDGAGKLTVVPLAGVKHTSAGLPNAPAAAADARGRNPRTESITDMAFTDGKLVVAGLSNEEFASKLRAIPYPFASVDRGASVEIYHGNHGQFETRSPVISFVPYQLDNQAHLIAGYTCTPLVKFPVASLTPGARSRGRPSRSSATATGRPTWWSIARAQRTTCSSPTRAAV